jgi:hypothetical protein
MSAQPQNLWERACSRWRRYIQHQCKLTHCYREQARSHRGFGVGMGSVGYSDNPCGSEPARDDGGIVNIAAS